MSLVDKITFTIFNFIFKAFYESLLISLSISKKKHVKHEFKNQKMNLRKR
jgi:hypothetical protein